MTVAMQSNQLNPLDDEWLRLAGRMIVGGKFYDEPFAHAVAYGHVAKALWRLNALANGMVQRGRGFSQSQREWYKKLAMQLIKERKAMMRKPHSSSRDEEVLAIMRAKLR